MAGAAEYIGESDTVLVMANAGNWIQNAGQLRRAIRATHANFDRDGNGLFVVSDKFKLGKTGEEPLAAYQNPFSALGHIARNAQELLRHVA